MGARILGEDSTLVLSIRPDSMTASDGGQHEGAALQLRRAGRRPRRGRGVSVISRTSSDHPVGAAPEDRCLAKRIRLASDVSPSRSMTMPPAIAR